MCASNRVRALVAGAVWCVLALFCLPTAGALDVVPQTAEFYVNDAAGILSADTKKYIIDTNVRLRNACGAQVVVVSVASLGGASIEEYATTLLRQYGIGDAQKNNGVLFLLALEERKFRIEVGYGLEGALNDAKAGRIQDAYMIPYFSNGDWNTGMRNGFTAVIEEIKKEYNISLDAEAPVVRTQPAVDEGVDPDTIVGLFFLGAGILGAVFGKIRKIGWIFAIAGIMLLTAIIGTLFGVLYAVLGGFGCALFMLIGYAITSPDTGSGHGGGYGGGRSRAASSRRSTSSWSSGSSGSRYSGGGGSSGGGGASRSF